MIKDAYGKESNSIVAWNHLTTSIGLREKLSPPELARTYALTRVSMYNSLLASNQTDQNDNINGRSITVTGATSTAIY
jgi:hypothetical protein